MAYFGMHMLPSILLYTTKHLYWRSFVPRFLSLNSEVLPETFLGVPMWDSNSVYLCTFLSPTVYSCLVFPLEPMVLRLLPGSCVLFLLWWPLIKLKRNLLLLPTEHFFCLLLFIFNIDTLAIIIYSIETI